MPIIISSTSIKTKRKDAGGLKYYDPVYYHEGKEDQRLMSAVECTEVINEEIRIYGYFVIITSEKMTAQGSTGSL